MKPFFPTFLLSALATFCTTSQAAERIVSTAGNASEVVAILGKADLLVGVDTTSMRPPEIMAAKAKIGYRRQLSAEGILSLQPDLILLAPDAGPAAVLEQIKSSGVPLLLLKDEQSLAGIRADIASIAQAIGAEAAGEKLLAELQADEAALEKLRQHSTEKTALVLIDTGSQGVFAQGSGSAGAHLLDILQLKNRFDAEGNKPIAAEALAASDADVIFLASRAGVQEAAIIAPLDPQHPQYAHLSATAAAQKGCVFSVNLLDTLGFGAYTARVAQQLLSTAVPCLH